MQGTSVVVAGGGIIGWTCAVELVQRGARVLVVDDAAGAAATPYAAGILFPNGTHRAQGGPGLLNRRAMELWPEWVSYLPLPLYRRHGFLQLADSEASLQQLKEWREIFAEESTWVDAAGVRDLAQGVNADRVRRALYLPDVGSVDPQHLLYVLQAFGRSLGVRTLSARVEDTVLRDGRVVGVRLTHGPVECEHLVICTGQAISQWGNARGDAIPVHGQIGERTVLRLTDTISPASHPGHPIVGTPGGSLVPRGDGRIWAGVTARPEGRDHRATVHGVLHVLGNAVSWMPELERARILDVGAGLRPMTPDGLPVVGASQHPGLWLVGGHGRDGILQSPLAAKMLAALLDTRDEALRESMGALLRLCDPGRFPTTQ